MAVKRKPVENSGEPSPKRTQIGSEEASEDGWGSDDYKVNYTDNGERRAESEARRQWNYVCPVQSCGQRFNRPCRLESHMRSHNKERPFACTEPGCDKTFPRKDHLQRHLKNAHSDPVTERTFTCDWDGCGKSFTNNGRLQRHKDAHESKFYCTGYPPCKEAFRKATTLDAHIKSQHLDLRPYPCTHVEPESGESCTAAFLNESALKRHIGRFHTKGEGGGHFCMLCQTPGVEMELMQIDSGEIMSIPTQPLCFDTREELAAHNEDYHPPICTECAQTFKTNATLKSHFDTVHADPASQPHFPCPDPNCDSVFNRKHNLTVHVQSVHEKQFKYLCAPECLSSSKHADLRSWDGENACGAAFKAKSSLDQHVRTHHLGLGNRKELRKAAKTKKQSGPSTLTLLTGVGYEKGKDIPCLVASCQHRFHREHNLRRHLCNAPHHLPEQEVEDMIRERNATTGGQFWIGGLDDTVPMFDSAEPSMPQTPMPMPYFTDTPGMPFLGPGDAFPSAKNGGLQQQYGLFDPQLGGEDLAMFLAEDAEMDRAMGLEGLEAPVDAHEGLQWDMLAPVEQFNMEGLQG
ncbi:zinc finger protein 585A [Pyrenochaeta sp. DS3sAY3a]|nr:zinc finger protein 585A [Pyrenochaeta sp. DS3sAY3a]